MKCQQPPGAAGVWRGKGAEGGWRRQRRRREGAQRVRQGWWRRERSWRRQAGSKQPQKGGGQAGSRGHSSGIRLSSNTNQCRGVMCCRRTTRQGPWPA
ncbi:hypothetical protein T484DRAFT_1988667 [Baffinella frigidus]|nr:hypothetical protein T484DRAFT_1988667 [Cryptophyta sp. CCMP2293]